MKKLLAALALAIGSAAASAAIIPTPLPFILQNGQTADATQVMSDFNTIVTNVNANAANAATSAQINITNTFSAPQIIPNGTGLGYVANISQIDQNSTKYVTDTGAANAYVVAPSPAWVSYIGGSDLLVTIGVGNTNTGASTINVNGLGAKNITNADLSALVPFTLQASSTYHLIYDGTEFVVVGSQASYGQAANLASAGTLNLDTTTGDYLHVTGTTTITAITLSKGRRRNVVFDGALVLTNGASLILPGGINITTIAGDSYTFVGEGAGVVRMVSWMRGNASPKQPTRTALTSGSGTYTTPAGAVRLFVRISGGGGGGGAASNGGSSGGAGGTTTFGTSFLTAGGGGAGICCGGTGGAGGSASGGDINIQGGSGAIGLALANIPGGSGGNAAGLGNGGGDGQTGTGFGGGGGGANSGGFSGSGGAGGGGGYVEKLIIGPNATYAYSVGTAGGAGAGGNGGIPGAGTGGIIIIDEYYQ